MYFAALGLLLGLVEERIVAVVEVLACGVVLRGRRRWVWVLVVLLWVLDEFVRLGMKLDVRWVE